MDTSSNDGLRGAQCLKCPGWLEKFLKDGECPEDCMNLGKGIQCCVDLCNCCDSCGNCFQSCPCLEFIQDFTMSTIVFFFHVLFNGTFGLFVDFGDFEYLKAAGQQDRTREMKYIFGIEIILLVTLGAITLISASYTYIMWFGVVFVFLIGAEFSVLMCNEANNDCTLGVGAMMIFVVGQLVMLAYCYIKLALSLHSTPDDPWLNVILAVFYVLVTFHFQKDYSLVTVVKVLGLDYKDKMTQFTSWGNCQLLMHLVLVRFWATNKDSVCMVGEGFVIWTTVISGLVLSLRHFSLHPKDSPVFFLLPTLDFLTTAIALSVEFQKQKCDVVLGFFTLTRLVSSLFGVFTSLAVFPRADFMESTSYAGRHEDLPNGLRLLGFFFSCLRVVFLLFVGFLRGFYQFSRIIIEAVHWLLVPLSCWNGDLEAKHDYWSSQDGFQNDREEPKRKCIEVILFGTVFWFLVSQFPQFVGLDSITNSSMIVFMNLSALVLVIVGSWFGCRLASKDSNGKDKTFAYCVNAMQLRSFGELLLVLTVIMQFVSLANHVDSDTWPWQECITFLITFFCVVVFMLTPYIWDTDRRVVRTMYLQWDIQNKDAFVTILLTLLETYDLKDSRSATWGFGVAFTIILMIMQWVASFLLIDSYDILGKKMGEFNTNGRIVEGWEKPIFTVVCIWLIVVAFVGTVPVLFIALSLGFHNFSPVTLTFLILKVFTFGRACYLASWYFQRGSQWKEECNSSSSAGNDSTDSTPDPSLPAESRLPPSPRAPPPFPPSPQDPYSVEYRGPSRLPPSPRAPPPQPPYSSEWGGDPYSFEVGGVGTI